MLYIIDYFKSLPNGTHFLTKHSQIYIVELYASTLGYIYDYIEG